MAVDLTKLTVEIRKTPDGKLYAAGFPQFGDADFFRFTFAEWPAGSFDSNLAQANAALDADTPSK